MSTLPALVPGSLPALPAATVESLAQYAHDARGAFSQNTVRAIKADTAIFGAWCSEQGVSPLPATPETVSAFIDAMGASKAVATIRRYVASIAHMHSAAKAGEPTRDAKVKLALKRLARAKGTRQRQAAPLGRATLDAIIGALGDRLIDQRNAAMFAVAYDTMVRRSALVALNVEDLAFTDDGAATILVRREKTDQEGAGSVRYLAPATVKHLNAWLTAAGITGGALFRGVTRHGVVGDRLATGEIPAILRKVAVAAGADPKGLSGHSARVGAAQDMIAAGLDLGGIMQAGDWKTATMPARYSERLIAQRGAAAQLAKIQGRT